MDYLVPILIIGALVILNGVYVAAEFAIACAPHTRVAQMVEAGSNVARRILGILRNPYLINRYISTAQIGITLATLGLGMYGEHTVTHWLEGPLATIPWIGEAVAHSVALVLAVAIITYLHVVIGEMVPKSLALQSPAPSAVALNGVMTWSERIFLPLTIILNATGDAILQFVGIPPARPEERLVSSEELEFIVAESSDEGLLEPSERVFLENVLDFQERNVGQVMTPRTRVLGLSVDLGQEDALNAVCVNRHSRYPVYDGNLDHIVGILHVKDLARYLAYKQHASDENQEEPEEDEFDLRKLVRKPLFVPESVGLEPMLARFRQEHSQFAAVVDEYGGVAGIVTMEDLAEELVGEIQDEYDEELPPFERIGVDRLRVRGDLLLDELEQHFELELAHDDADTVGGLIMAQLGHVAEPRDHVEFQDLTFEVETVDGLAVHTAIVSLPTSKDRRKRVLSEALTDDSTTVNR